MVMYIAAVTIYSHSAGRSVGPLYAETPVLGFRNFHSLPCMSPASSVYACVFSHVQLFVTINCSPPGSSERGLFQARILEWVVISFSRGSSRPRDRTHIASSRTPIILMLFLLDQALIFLSCLSYPFSPLPPTFLIVLLSKNPQFIFRIPYLFFLNSYQL